MDLASGYSDSINYGNGYTPLANNAINNNNANYWSNQATVALMAQQAMDQHNAAIQAQGPSSGYGTVGGYPSFGDPSPVGPGTGRSSFSGAPLYSGGQSVFDTGVNASYNPNAPFGGGYVGASSSMGSSGGNFNTSGYFNANPDALDIFKNQGGWGTSDPTQFAQTHFLAAHNAEGGGWRTGWEPTANANFDTAGYYAANPDAWQSFAGSGGYDPTAFAEQHLRDAYNNPGDRSMRTGWASNPNFDAEGYFKANPDAWQAFADGGWGISDPTAFAEQHLKSAYNNPADRSIRGGWEAANSNFDTAGYYAANPDAWQAYADGGWGINDPTAFAEQHLKAAYNNPGDRSMRGGWSDNSDFDAAGYYAANPDAWRVYANGGWGDNDPTSFAKTHLAAAHLNPAEGGGYRSGWITDSDPNFDTEGWFAAHPDSLQTFLGEDNPYTNPTAYAEMSNFQSPSNDYSTFQKGPSYNWQASIPKERFDPNTINEVYRVAGQYGFSPAALAAIINMESTWDPNTATGSYRGMTQMGPTSFAEAPGGRLGGLSWADYLKATPAQQIATYGNWIDHYAKTDPNNAASLVKGGIGSLPPEMQAAIMQGTQFGPNSTDWVRALGEGNMSMRTTPSGQADALGDTSINAMRDAFAKIIAGWPQSPGSR